MGEFEEFVDKLVDQHRIKLGKVPAKERYCKNERYKYASEQKYLKVVDKLTEFIIEMSEEVNEEDMKTLEDKLIDYFEIFSNECLRNGIIFGMLFNNWSGDIPQEPKPIPRRYKTRNMK